MLCIIINNVDWGELVHIFFSKASESADNIYYSNLRKAECLLLRQLNIEIRKYCPDIRHYVTFYHCVIRLEFAAQFLFNLSDIRPVWGKTADETRRGNGEWQEQTWTESGQFSSTTVTDGNVHRCDLLYSIVINTNLHCKLNLFSTLEKKKSW